MFSSIHFNTSSFRNILIYIEPFSSSILVYIVYLNLYWSVSTYLGSSQSILVLLGFDLSWSISGYLALSLAILDYLGLSQAIPGYLGLSWATLSYLGLYVNIMCYLWLYLDISGYFNLKLYWVNMWLWLWHERVLEEFSLLKMTATAVYGRVESWNLSIGSRLPSISGKILTCLKKEHFPS